MNNRLTKILFSVFLFLIILEIILRISGKYKTAYEISSGNYVYRYHRSKNSWLHNWQPNKTINYTLQEFSYKNSYNEFGIREIPLSSFMKDTASEKILCIGDSFTEGDGAPYDSSWVRNLERLANKNQLKRLQFYNAGVCGSDVFFNHKWLVSDLMQIKPKWILECINTSDINDIIWFGGNERFNLDGTCTGKTGPKWEVIYKYSHLFRKIVHKYFGYNANLIKPEAETIAIKLIKDELIKTHNWCKQNHINYKVILQLCPHELCLTNFYPKLFKELNNLAFVIDISNDLKAAIPYNKYLKYSWLANGHFNSQGYLILAECIYKNINFSIKKAS